MSLGGFGGWPTRRTGLNSHVVGRGLALEQLHRGRPAGEQLLDALYITANRGPRLHHFLADGIYAVGWYYIFDDTESVPGERVGATRYYVFERQRAGAEGVSPGAGKLGGDGLGVVSRSSKEIAGCMQLLLKASGFGVELRDVHRLR